MGSSDGVFIKELLGVFLLRAFPLSCRLLRFLVFTVAHDGSPAEPAKLPAGNVFFADGTKIKTHTWLNFLKANLGMLASVVYLDSEKQRYGIYRKTNTGVRFFPTK